MRAAIATMSALCSQRQSGRKEDIFVQSVGKFGLHDVLFNNEVILVDFAATRNMVIGSTKFQHLNIHKATSLSPDQNTRN